MNEFLIWSLPIAALMLILVASVSNRIEDYFEKMEEEEYESTTYQSDYYKTHCEGKEQ